MFSVNSHTQIVFAKRRGICGLNSEDKKIAISQTEVIFHGNLVYL